MKMLINKALFVFRIINKSLTIKKVISISKYILDTKLRGKKIPGGLILGLTYRCQCNCDYCSVGKYHVVKSKELTTLEVKKLINLLRSLGVIKLNFFGGEPLICKDLADLSQYASSKGLFVFIDTNGYLLDAKKARMFKRAGVTAVNINMSSQIESKCAFSDSNMRKTFFRMSECIQFCVDENLTVLLSVFVEKEIVVKGILEKIITFAKKNKAKGVRLLLPMLCGNLFNSSSGLTGNDLDRVYSLVDNYFVYVESIFYGMNKNKKYCDATLKKTIYISPYGDVQMCYTVPYSFGNIREEPLESIIKKMWSSRLFLSAPKDSCVMNDPEFRCLVDNMK